VVHDRGLVLAAANRAGPIPGFPDTAIRQRKGVSIDVHVGFGRNKESDVHGVMEPPLELAVRKTTIHGQRNDYGMISQVGDSLLNNFVDKMIDVAHFDCGKTQGEREAAYGVPNHPDFEAKDGFKHLSDAPFPSPQFGCFFFGDLAASRALLGGLDFGRIHEGMDLFWKERMGGQDSHNPIEEPL
jgi:hypothetical protein